MRVRTWFRENYLLLVAVSVFGTWFLIFPLRSHTQNNCPTPAQGNNAVYNPACNPNVVGSPAFIDANVFAGSTFCSTIYNILSGNTGIAYPAGGAVVDARGLNSTNTSMTCRAPHPNGAFCATLGRGFSFVNLSPCISDELGP